MLTGWGSWGGGRIGFSLAGGRYGHRCPGTIWAGTGRFRGRQLPLSSRRVVLVVVWLRGRIIDRWRWPLHRWGNRVGCRRLALGLRVKCRLIVVGQRRIDSGVSIRRMVHEVLAI